MSTPQEIWVWLVFEGEQHQPCRVRIKPDKEDVKIVYDLKEKVYKECPKKLQYCQADDLFVYPPGTNVTTKGYEKTHYVENAVCSKITGGSFDAPFVVVAPKNPFNAVAPDPEEGRRQAENKVTAEGGKRKRSRIEPTWESSLGTHTVPMETDALLEYIEGFQFESKIQQSTKIHSDVERKIKLQGRKIAIDRTLEVFRKRKNAYVKYGRPRDYTQYPVVVYSGMRGMGKTRMLEECQSIVQTVDENPNVSTVISYGNDDTKGEIEYTMPIEATFGWRLLHQIFVEDNSENPHVVSSWNHKHFLPANANQLKLQLAIDVVLSGAKKALDIGDGPLSLFIGIDGYHKIPKGPDYDPNGKGDRSDHDFTFLWRLIYALDTCGYTEGLHLYIALAGTEWLPLDITGSSIPFMNQAPLTTLGYQSTENVVRSIENQSILRSPQKRRELFFLGGIPRPSVEFALADGNNFDQVWKDYIRKKWGNKLKKDLLKLIAFATNGVKKVWASDRSFIRNMKWGELVDKGFCLIDDNGFVGLPYCVFRLAAMELDKDDFEDLPSKCLLQNLQYMHKQVDESLYELEDWQAWETFGACIFSMRVNALQLVGISQVRVCNLFEGAVTKGCHDVVRLRPMEVHAIKEQLSKELKESVTEKTHHGKLNWVKGGEGGVRYCLINGVSGKGVDFFATLPLVGKNELLLYNDQRKMVASSLGETTAKALLEKTKIIPDCIASTSKCVGGLFSALASFNGEASNIPEDCVVLSHSQNEVFHGTLSVHPACRPFVDVNFDNVSTLELLKSVKELAPLIIAKREAQEFETVDDFCDYCNSEGYTVSNEDRHRVVAKS